MFLEFDKKRHYLRVTLLTRDARLEETDDRVVDSSCSSPAGRSGHSTLGQEEERARVAVVVRESRVSETVAYPLT